MVESSPWRCEDCASMAPSNLASEVNNRVANTIKILEENGLDPESCEKFIMVHSRILHPQHAHMLDVKHSFLHLMGHHEGFLMADLTEKQLQMKEETARCILNVANKVIPGKINFLQQQTSVFRINQWVDSSTKKLCLKNTCLKKFV